MTRISAGFGGLDVAARNGVWQAFSELGRASLQLATMSRLNAGRDDPAGLIQLGQLQSELAALEAEGRVSHYAEAVVSVADAGLSQASTLVASLRGTLVAAAGNTISDPERAAYQQEIDATLGALNRIAGGTQFAGRTLLDGSASAVSLALGAGAESAVLSLPDVHTTALGGAAGVLADLASGGTASLTSGNSAAGFQIVEDALAQLNTARAGVGAFARATLDSAAAARDAAEVAAASGIRELSDLDVAEGMSRLVRAQILAESSLAVLRVSAERRSLFAGLWGE